MKISYMMKREPFFVINKKTLEKYYSSSTSARSLYVYPELNAIVTVCPSASVKKYIYTEYRVSGSFLKRLAVKLYAKLLLNSFGLLSAKRIRLLSNANKNTLIYPCNKKYRIFDFENNTVTVTPKVGFPTGDLKKEIEFRTTNQADFIPKLISFCEDGYTEAIIDGAPVVRSRHRVYELSDTAYRKWSSFIEPTFESVCVTDYADTLMKELTKLSSELVKRDKQFFQYRVTSLFDKLIKEIIGYGGELLVGLSHGDLQSGNIWVENGSDKIYIIDWESYGRRSVFYDKATLYEGLRMADSLKKFVLVKDLSHAVVLAEDLVYRLKELSNLPENFGCEEFEIYLKVLEDRYV